MLSNNAESSKPLELPVLTFQYPVPVGTEPKVVRPAEEPPQVQQVTMPEATYRERIAEARQAAISETETRLRAEFDETLSQQSARISDCIAKFQKDHQAYFAKVETEVIQLALGIARKILHRESQVDPTLVAAIVQIALGQLKEGSVVQLKVCAGQAARWREHFARLNLLLTVTIVEDADLHPGDCILETEVGELNVSVEGQLKEIESGFLDVLAQRPKL